MSSPYETPSADLQGGNVMRPCKGCGKMIHVTASACPDCGASQRSQGYKSKVMAAVLAFFLGGFGVHRFYLGQWWGLLYLLLFWTMIPGFVALVEFIVFLVCDQAKWDDKYNEGIPAGPNDKSSVALVILLVVVGGFVVIAIIGILAAIAIPQYAEYTHRARIAGAVAQTLQTKQTIIEFYYKHEVLPDSNIMAGLPEPYLLEGNHEIAVFGEGFELIFSSESPDIDQRTIVFIPFLAENNSIAWSCVDGSLEQRYRPLECRN